MKIACLIPGGLGGTQKAGWLFASGLARLGHEVTGFSPPGPSVPATPCARLTVSGHPTDAAALPEIADGGFDAIHVHMPGYFIRHPLYPFLKKLGASRPRVVETNVFGRLQDNRSNPFTDYRLFISLTGACQAANRAWTGVARLKNCGVARYPVETAAPVSAGRRETVRRRFGVESDEVMALRLGRPDPAKWSDFECGVVSRLRRETGTRMKLVAIEPPPPLAGRIRRGEFGAAVVAAGILNSPSDVAEILAASDVIFHAARFGESFGYAIAEGMAAGKPVVTLTTPWGDNAQTELVENGITGFVCCSEEGAAGALGLLCADPGLRRAMGAASGERISALADPENECRIVSAAIEGNTQAFAARKEEILAYARAFASRQWDVIERSHADLMPSAPKILARAKIRSARLGLIKRVSNLRASVRALFGLPSFR